MKCLTKSWHDSISSQDSWRFDRLLYLVLCSMHYSFGKHFSTFVMAHISMKGKLEGAPNWFEVSRAHILAKSCKYILRHPAIQFQFRKQERGSEIGSVAEPENARSILHGTASGKSDKNIGPSQLCRSSCYSCQGRHLCAATACSACSITAGTCAGSGEQTFACQMRWDYCASKFVEKVGHSWHFWALHAIM